MEFSSYFNVMWEEPRLHIPDSYLSYLNITDLHAMFPVNLELVNHLWLPNVFIYNLKTFKVGRVYTLYLLMWAIQFLLTDEYQVKTWIYILQ